MDESDDIFDEALAAFRGQQSSDLLDSFANVRASDVKRDILSTQRDQEYRKALMDLRRIEFIVKAFEQFEDAASLTSELSSGIWGPLKYSIKVAKDDAGVLDSLVGSYRDLGSKVPPTGNFKQVLIETPASKKCLALMYYDFLTFQGRVVHMLSGNTWKKTFRADWQDYKPSFDVILKSFEYHSDIIKRLQDDYGHRRSTDSTQLLSQHIQNRQDDREHIIDILQQYDDRHVQRHADSTQRLNQFMENYQDDRENIIEFLHRYELDRDELLRRAKAEEASRREERFADVMLWFTGRGSLQKKYHVECQEKRQPYPKTGQWILEKDVVRAWLDADLIPQHSVLWIHGKIGAGKTILASLIIDECQAQSGYKTSYFYCRDHKTDGRKNESLAIYKSLLAQMLEHYPDLLPFCYEKRSKSPGALEDISTVQSLIELFCSVEMNQFIVLDGLDECEKGERKAVISFLAGLVNKCDDDKPGKIRLLLVSRDLADMHNMKALQNAATFGIEREDSQKDIVYFVNKRAEKLREKFDLEEGELFKACQLTCQQADGVFLFASLTMQNLLDQPRVKEFLDELRKDAFPKELKEVYDRIIRRLSTQPSWPVARTIFGWLACAKRPLQWHEIQAVLSMDPDERGTMRMSYHANKLREDIRTVCGSLVHVFPETRIEFVHQTAREHIVMTAALDEKTIECDLAVLCLTYLAAPWFQAGEPAEEGSEEGTETPEASQSSSELENYASNGYFAFQDYAIAVWGEHVQTIIKCAAFVLADATKAKAYELKLLQALSAFTEKYAESLAAEDSAPPSEDQTPQNDCLPFQPYRFHGQLVQLWTHIYRHNMLDQTARDAVSLKSMRESMERTRKALQKMAPRAHIRRGPAEDPLRELYGPCFFKCPKVTCPCFYEGFETSRELDSHLMRHKRPFCCEVEGCTYFALGFLNKKDLNKHVKRDHPENAAQSEFTPLSRELIDPEHARHDCRLCGKRFTRKGILNDHIRSHSGERPHECRTCGRAFTRRNDRDRHERTLHAFRRRG